MDRPRAHGPILLDALKLICSPEDFYAWINLAGPDDVPASILRVCLLQALVTWADCALNPQDALYIAVSIFPAKLHRLASQRGL